MILSGPFFLPYRFFCTSWNPLALGVRVNVESCWYKQGLQKTFSFAVFRFPFFSVLLSLFPFFLVSSPFFFCFFQFFMCGMVVVRGCAQANTIPLLMDTPPALFLFPPFRRCFLCFSKLFKGVAALSTRVCQVVALSSLVVNVAVEVGQLLCPVFSLRSLCVWRAINV